MNIETKRKLNAMNMQDIAESIEDQEVNPAFYAQLSFEERLSSLIDDIYQKRHNEKIQRRIKQAKLRYPSASIADVDYVCLFRIIPARYLGNCRPHQNGEANYAEGYLKADRQDIL